MREPFSLAGRTAIITGAASGIGAATAVLFARQGASVVVGFNPSHAHDPAIVVDAITAQGGDAVAYAVDVANEQSVASLVALCEWRMGPAQIVVANAGVVRRTPTEQLTAADFRTVLDVDLLGVHNVFAATVGGMRDAGWGRLLATSSTSGTVFGWEQRAAYCAAKAGVSGLVKTYAVEFGSNGVTANAVAPGVVRSPQSLDEVSSLGPAGLAAVAGSIPVGRVGEPADVAAVFAFLAGDGAAFITGQTLTVDGGQSTVEAG